MSERKPRLSDYTFPHTTVPSRVRGGQAGALNQDSHVHVTPVSLTGQTWIDSCKPLNSCMVCPEPTETFWFFPGIWNSSTTVIHVYVIIIMTGTKYSVSARSCPKYLKTLTRVILPIMLCNMYHYYSHLIKLHLQFQGEKKGIEELVCSIKQGALGHRHLC